MTVPTGDGLQVMKHQWSTVRAWPKKGAPTNKVGVFEFGNEQSLGAQECRGVIVGGGVREG